LGNSHQPAKARPGAQLFAQQAVFPLQLHGAGHALQPRAQFFQAKRLGHIIHCAERVAVTAESMVPYCVNTITAT